MASSISFWSFIIDISVAYGTSRVEINISSTRCSKALSASLTNSSTASPTILSSSKNDSALSAILQKFSALRTTRRTLYTHDFQGTSRILPKRAGICRWQPGLADRPPTVSSSRTFTYFSNCANSCAPPQHQRAKIILSTQLSRPSRVPTSKYHVVTRRVRCYAAENHA